MITEQAQRELFNSVENMTGPLVPEHKPQLLEACQWQRVEQGQVLIKPGDHSQQWQLVLQGQLCGYRDEIKTVDQADYYRSAGDSFGQAALLTDGNYHLSLVAATTVRLVVFEREAFDLLWHHYDSFKQVIASELAMLHAQTPLRPFKDNKTTLFCQASTSPYTIDIYITSVA